ncbi:MAG: hypothetical protein JJU40_10770 [Rhodobacteraceae bacterium]|nr:hypothetical protein [Paracoccaceae bacterium]
MARIAINPGTVDWSGENPGIYLKSDPAGDYSALALFFRVVFSPHGRGHAAIVLGAPDTGAGWPDVPNLIMTDNQPMMRWIIDGWVRHMPTFRGRAGLPAMTWLHCDRVEKTPADIRSRYSEKLIGPDTTVEMVWRDMGPPIPAEVGVADSATGAHEMYSVFLEAASADILIDGFPLPGQVASRSFFGRTMSTAFLAFSETWVTPAAT